jgi:hypothetical protein
MKGNSDMLHIIKVSWSYKPCCNCGDMINLNNDDYLEKNDEIYCQDCFDESFAFCDNCNEYHLIDDVSYFENFRHGVSLCDDCRDSLLTRCDDCGDWVNTNDAYRTAEGDDICGDCYGDNYFTCDGCGNIYHSDYINSTDDGCYCNECYEEEEKSDLIHKYGYKPTPEFMHLGKELKSKALFMGFELELESQHLKDDAKETTQHLPYCYLKEDGSIDCGFEIVSHPATLAYHLSSEANLKKAFTALRKSGAKSHDTSNCGLHVHVSRAFFSNAEEVKLGLFIYTQKSRMVTLARRECGYAKYKPVKGIMAKVNHAQEGRYEAVNYENDNTIEFRIFKGTLKETTFKATLEFVDCLSYFVKEYPAYKFVDVDKTWADFIAFMDKREYFHLPAYLLSKGLMVEQGELVLV